MSGRLQDERVAEKELAKSWERKLGSMGGICRTAKEELKLKQAVGSPRRLVLRNAPTGVFAARHYPGRGDNEEGVKSGGEHQSKVLDVSVSSWCDAQARYIQVATS